MSMTSTLDVESGGGGGGFGSAAASEGASRRLRVAKKPLERRIVERTGVRWP